LIETLNILDLEVGTWKIKKLKQALILLELTVYKTQVFPPQSMPDQCSQSTFVSFHLSAGAGAMY
jgi:hypothetical protein